MFYIIGSGHAGVSAAVALINRGMKVTMLDVGFELEKDKTELLTKINSLDKDDWDDEIIKKLKGNMDVHSQGVKVKNIYGSDYPYRGIKRYQPVKQNKSSMVRSLAKGGLSNVWGASILPYQSRDINDWPIGIKELELHYRAVLSFMPISGFEDDLASEYPLYSSVDSFQISRQISNFMGDMLLNKDLLKGQGFSFGHSRLAVNFKSMNRKRGCNYCGLCLYGCPYGLIYSSCQTLDWLMDNPKFKYISGVLVKRLTEKNDEVEITATDLNRNKNKIFKCSRVLLGAGTVSSTRILLESMDAYNRPVYFKHSDHFQIPLLRYDKIDNVMTERIHTLTQMFIELYDKRISENTIHMQCYSYNDLYLNVLNKMFGPLTKIFDKNIENFLGKLLIIKGYLHSDISSEIVGYLEPGSNGSFVLQGKPNHIASTALKKIKSKFSRNKKYFQAIPSPVFTKLSQPGIGNHSGSTFPMRKNPSEFESDLYGRPYGFKNVHLIDSTVFPSIPATTISLSIMANAHRIASHI